jgi:hypothetical protein
LLCKGRGVLGDTEVEGHAGSGASHQDGLGSTGTGDRRIRQPDELLPRYEAQMGRKCTASSPRWCWPRRRRLCHRHPAAATRTWTLPDNHRRAYKKALGTSSVGPRTSHLSACREPLVITISGSVKEGFSPPDIPLCRVSSVSVPASRTTSQPYSSRVSSSIAPYIGWALVIARSRGGTTRSGALGWAVLTMDVFCVVAGGADRLATAWRGWDCSGTRKQR